jgi:hypothetical protein
MPGLTRGVQWRKEHNENKNEAQWQQAWLKFLPNLAFLSTPRPIPFRVPSG